MALTPTMMVKKRVRMLLPYQRAISRHVESTVDPGFR
jgi:hypothetical protein